MLLALLSTLAHAEEYYLEATPVAEKSAALDIEKRTEAAGFDARVVRRFRLGKGWEFVVLVEHFTTGDDASKAAARLERELGGKVTAWRLDAGEKAVAIDLPAPAAPAVDQAASWLARARDAHGGPTGGTSAIARAGAVHFRFAREVELAGKKVTVRHDYWREGGSRRLTVDTSGAGQNSLAVATANGAWMKIGDAVQARDIGVTIGVVDTFAPEAVLTVALEAARLLEAPEVAQFHPLEGAESGLRFGLGGDESETGLSFVDIDPKSAWLMRVRYVSDAGPVTYELSGWQKAAAGVLVPTVVSIESADGKRENLKVEGLELLDKAPAETFAKPG
jgi:hypothetical protein